MRMANEPGATKEERDTLKRVMRSDRPPPIVAVKIPEPGENEENEGQSGNKYEEDIVKIGNSRVAITARAIHEQLEKAWRAIFNQPRKVTYEQFKKNTNSAFIRETAQ